MRTKKDSSALGKWRGRVHCAVARIPSSSGIHLHNIRELVSACFIDLGPAVMSFEFGKRKWYDSSMTNMESSRKRSQIDRRMPDIKRFRPEVMAQASVVLVLGKRFSGKSVLIKDMMYRFRDRVDKGIIFSGTEHAAPFYSRVFPDMYIHKKYDPERLERIIDKQSRVTKNQLLKTQSHAATPQSTVFVLMDDVLADNGWRNDETMKEIFFNGRHFHFLFFLASQYPMAIPAPFRTNADYTFIYSDKEKKNRKKIYENYCGMVPSLEEFEMLMDQVCQNYTCLVVDNRKKDHTHWTDSVFWYKAEERDDFRFGSEGFWRYHEKYIKDLDDENDTSAYWKGVVNRYGDNNVMQRIRLID